MQHTVTKILGNRRRSSMPPLWRTVLMFCLAACRVMDTDCLGLEWNIALVHDGRLDLLQPSRRVELWMTTILDDAHHLPCPSSISFTMFQMSTESVTAKNMAQHLAGTRAFQGFILAVADCLIADILEPILLSAETPFLRVDFLPCSPAVPGGYTTERLELYRLNDTNRDHCSSYAFRNWFERRICASSLHNNTQLLLFDVYATPFNVCHELQECTGLNDHQWVQSIHPAGLDIPEIVSRQHVNGKTLRFASLERPPFVILERFPNGTVSGFKGYCYEIVHVLQTMYNFTYEVEQPTDNTFGKEMSNGNWNGMIGMIVNKIVDMGVGPFSVTHSRSKVMSFSVAFYEDPATILIPPPAEDNRLLTCLKPFRLGVWLSLVFSVAVLPIIIWQHLKILWINYQRAAVSRSLNSPERHFDFKERYPSLVKQYFFVLGVLIGQSGQKMSSLGFSPRLLGAVWCLSAVVFASAYVGNLISFLSIPKLSPIISKLEDLPGSKLDWGVQPGTALESLFTEATVGVYKTIGEGLLKPGVLVERNKDGVERVTNGSYAFIKEKSYLEFAVEEDYLRSGSYRLSMAKQEFFKVNFAFALPTSSPLKSFLDKKVGNIQHYERELNLLYGKGGGLRSIDTACSRLFGSGYFFMLEAGLGEHWKKVYWPPSNNKYGDVKRSGGPKSLSLKDLQGAFLILAIGFIMSFVMFFVCR